ncbi:response regulator [Candidatus Riflebacteria bacterium]
MLDLQRILYLDDSRLARRMVAKIFTGSYITLSAASMQIALQMASRNDIACFLTDYMLPDGDGIEFAKKIRTIEKYQDTPIILVSAGLTTEMAFLAMKANINCSVQKPYESDELLKIVKKQLQNPVIEKVDRKLLSVLCIEWRNNEEYFQFSPDMNIIVKANTKVGAHEKMEAAINDALVGKGKDVENIMSIGTVTHYFKLQNLNNNSANSE